MIATEKRAARTMARKAPKPLERDINKGIKDILELDGWRIILMETVSDHQRRRYFGEPGMADMLCLRYKTPCKEHQKPRLDLICSPVKAEVLWIEGKRKDGKLSKTQANWHGYERMIGAFTIIAKLDFDPSIEGFFTWYKASGLMRKAMEL